MYKLFGCFKRKLSKEEKKKIEMDRIKMLPLYNKIIQNNIKQISKK